MAVPVKCIKHLIPGDIFAYRTKEIEPEAFVKFVGFKVTGELIVEQIIKPLNEEDELGDIHVPVLNSTLLTTKFKATERKRELSDKGAVDTYVLNRCSSAFIAVENLRPRDVIIWTENEKDQSDANTQLVLGEKYRVVTIHTSFDNKMRALVVLLGTNKPIYTYFKDKTYEYKVCLSTVKFHIQSEIARKVDAKRRRLEAKMDK